MGMNNWGLDQNNHMNQCFLLESRKSKQAVVIKVNKSLSMLTQCGHFPQKYAVGPAIKESNKIGYWAIQSDFVEGHSCFAFSRIVLQRPSKSYWCKSAGKIWTQTLLQWDGVRELTKIFHANITYTSSGQPRPQGFFLKKWVGRSIHFFKGKALGTRLVVGDEKVSSKKTIKSKLIYTGLIR